MSFAAARHVGSIDLTSIAVGFGEWIDIREQWPSMAPLVRTLHGLASLNRNTRGAPEAGPPRLNVPADSIISTEEPSARQTTRQDSSPPIAGGVGMLWLGQIATATTTGVPPADLAKAGLPTNPVHALDLGLFLPLCLVAGVGLLRDVRVAGAFALPMLIWLFLTSAGIVGGFAFAALAGDEVPLVVAVVVGTSHLCTSPPSLPPAARSSS